jgi:hypothetical protein
LPSQVTILLDPASGADSRRCKSGRPNHQHEPSAQQGADGPSLG